MSLVEIRYSTSYNYDFLGMARLQKDGRIYFQSTGFHREAPEQSLTIISWVKPTEK